MFHAGLIQSLLVCVCVRAHMHTHTYIHIRTLTFLIMWFNQYMIHSFEVSVLLARYIGICLSCSVELWAVYWEWRYGRKMAWLSGGKLLQMMQPGLGTGPESISQMTFYKSHDLHHTDLPTSQSCALLLLSLPALLCRGTLEDLQDRLDAKGTAVLASGVCGCKKGTGQLLEKVDSKLATGLLNLEGGV